MALPQSQLLLHSFTCFVATLRAGMQTMSAQTVGLLTQAAMQSWPAISLYACRHCRRGLRRLSVYYYKAAMQPYLLFSLSCVQVLQTMSAQTVGLLKSLLCSKCLAFSHPCYLLAGTADYVCADCRCANLRLSGP